jgi:hypothetical protein
MRIYTPEEEPGIYTKRPPIGGPAGDIYWPKKLNTISFSGHCTV